MECGKFAGKEKGEATEGVRGFHADLSPQLEDVRRSASDERRRRWNDAR